MGQIQACKGRPSANAKCLLCPYLYSRQRASPPSSDGPSIEHQYHYGGMRPQGAVMGDRGRHGLRALPGMLYSLSDFMLQTNAEIMQHVHERDHEQTLCRGRSCLTGCEQSLLASSMVTLFAPPTPSPSCLSVFSSADYQLHLGYGPRWRRDG